MRGVRQRLAPEAAIPSAGLPGRLLLRASRRRPAHPTRMRYFEDFAEGQVFELGEATLTEADVLEFARRYDPQPFHVDPAAARHSLYGGLIASDWQTGAVYMGLLVRGLLKDVASLGSGGIDELRWLKPVRP